MSIYGQIGNTTIAQQRLGNNVPQGMNPSFPQGVNQIPQPNQNQIIPQKPKKHTDYINFRINNPVVTNLREESQSVNYDVVKFFNSITIPDISQIQKIMETCENAKREYDDLIKILPEPEKKANSIPVSKFNNAPVANSNIFFGSGQSSYNDARQNNNSHMPVNDKYDDINKFVEKFKCPRETAVTYVDAFGSFEKAAQEYQK